MRDGEVRIAGDEMLVLATPAHAYRVRCRRSSRCSSSSWMRAGQPAGRRSFLGAAGPGDVVIGTSFDVERRRRSRSSPSEWCRRFSIRGISPRANRVGRDEALRRYFAMLVGGNSIEVDLHRLRPVQPPDALELAPGEHAHSSRRLTYVHIASGTGWLLDAYRCDAETGVVPIGGPVTLGAQDAMRIKPVGGGRA